MTFEPRTWIWKDLSSHLIQTSSSAGIINDNIILILAFLLENSIFREPGTSQDSLLLTVIVKKVFFISSHNLPIGVRLPQLILVLPCGNLQNSISLPEKFFKYVEIYYYAPLKTFLFYIKQPYFKTLFILDGFLDLLNSNYICQEHFPVCQYPSWIYDKLW